MEKLKHTKGPWILEKKPTAIGYAWRVGPIGACMYVDERGGVCNPDMKLPESEANATLIRLAPTAPHSCSDPSCPGDINRRKFQAAEGLAAAMRDALENCETCRGEKGPRRCARCLTFIKLLAAWEQAGKE